MKNTKCRWPLKSQMYRLGVKNGTQKKQDGSITRVQKHLFKQWRQSEPNNDKVHLSDEWRVRMGIQVTRHFEGEMDRFGIIGSWALCSSQYMSSFLLGSLLYAVWAFCSIISGLIALLVLSTTPPRLSSQGSLLIRLKLIIFIFHFFLTFNFILGFGQSSLLID